MHDASSGDNHLCEIIDTESRSSTEHLDLIWGVAAIALFIGRTPRQAYEALVKGDLPARRVNRRWVASRQKLRKFFDEADAA